ncbi:F0F1 ATP synthase subunit B [Alicyclobacillus cycloheptanicus]|uniref:ATP synthase subunit b n=1 Tax=Alicyclobacillus cycloheptanicus TaxID=1457 RepID=A0ABT9XI20_9BACL|nr:F0F1 ATP synthase subunit B [Alicyclobacillus cycloheptanicus]MDQ0189423.1 F-type H+-transporting ATPase subunit b [Alicyclobacillus cycloheptanicus]
MFETGTFVVSIVTFLILFWLIQRFGFKPLANIMEQRRLHVEKQISDAEQQRAEAEKLLAEQRALLEQARQDARNLLDAARARADEQARSIIAEAQAESQRLLDEARQLIERERTEALNAALQQVAEITVELTSKLLRNHVSETVHKEMLQEAEKQLGELVC